MSRCRCHDMLTEDCDRLRGIEAKEAVERRADEARWDRLLGQRHVFASRYSGECDQCGERFPAGAPIKAVGDSRYLGPCCIEETNRATG